MTDHLGRSARSSFERVAPRLARAYAAEREYQRRKADCRRRGVVSMEVASEEMIRSMRLIVRHTTAVMRRWHRA